MKPSQILQKTAMSLPKIEDQAALLPVPPSLIQGEFGELASKFMECIQPEGTGAMIAPTERMLQAWLAKNGISLNANELKLLFKICESRFERQRLIESVIKTSSKQPASETWTTILIRAVREDRDRAETKEQLEAEEQRRTKALREDEERRNSSRYADKVKSATHTSPAFLDPMTIGELNLLLTTNNLPPGERGAVQHLLSELRLKRTD